jgi:hypothetical protein
MIQRILDLMNRATFPILLSISIVVSIFGVLLQMFTFGRDLLGLINGTDLVIFLCIGLVPGLFLAPVFRRWNGAIFVVGNAAMFGSAWYWVLFIENEIEQATMNIAIPLGIYLAGAVLVAGTGVQFCDRILKGAPQPAQRVGVIVLVTSVIALFFPLAKIEIEFTVYFAISGIASAANLLMFALAGGMLEGDLPGDVSASEPAPAKKGIGGILTLFGVIGAILAAQVSYYLGQNSTYAAERTVFVWPFAAVAAGAYIVIHHYVKRNFAPVVAPAIALISVLLSMAGAPWAYGWGQAALVGSVYAFAIITFLEFMPRWVPSNARWVGPFFAITGWFTIVGIVVLGYAGGTPVHPPDIPPVLNALVYFCAGLIFAGLVQAYCVNKLAGSRGSE